MGQNSQTKNQSDADWDLFLALDDEQPRQDVYRRIENILWSAHRLEIVRTFLVAIRRMEDDGWEAEEFPEASDLPDHLVGVADRIIQFGIEGSEATRDELSKLIRDPNALLYIHLGLWAEQSAYWRNFEPSEGESPEEGEESDEVPGEMINDLGMVNAPLVHIGIGYSGEQATAVFSVPVANGSIRFGIKVPGTSPEEIRELICNTEACICLTLEKGNEESPDVPEFLASEDESRGRIPLQRDDESAERREKAIGEMPAHVPPRPLMARGRFKISGIKLDPIFTPLRHHGNRVRSYIVPVAVSLLLVALLAWLVKDQNQHETPSVPKQTTIASTPASPEWHLITGTNVRARSGSMHHTVHSREEYLIGCRIETVRSYGWLYQIDSRRADLLRKASRESEPELELFYEEGIFDDNTGFEFFLIILGDEDLAWLSPKGEAHWLLPAERAQLQELGKKKDMKQVLDVCLKALHRNNWNGTVDDLMVLKVEHVGQ